MQSATTSWSQWRGKASILSCKLILPENGEVLETFSKSLQQAMHK